MKKSSEGIEAEDVVKGIKHNLPVEFFKTLARSFWPPAYKEMVLLTIRRVFSYFFWLVILSYVLMILAGIPAVYMLKSDINSALSSFDRISINASVAMNKELYVPQLGVGLDVRDGVNMTNERVFITGKEIQVRNMVCNVVPICGMLKEPYTAISLQTLARPTENKAAFTDFVFWLVIFLIPSILATILVFIFAKYILISLVLWLFGMLLVRLFNKRLRIDRIYKVGIFALTPMIIIETINLVYARNLYYIPTILLMIFYIAGIAFAGERGSKSY